MECGEVVEKGSWEAGKYFVGERLDIYIHFTPKFGVNNQTPKPKVYGGSESTSIPKGDSQPAENGSSTPKASGRNGSAFRPTHAPRLAGHHTHTSKRSGAGQGGSLKGSLAGSSLPRVSHGINLRPKKPRVSQFFSTQVFFLIR